MAKTGRISIVDIQHQIIHERENHQYTILIWGCGEDDDGIRRWASHLQPISDHPELDWKAAFNECQKKIIAMFPSNEKNGTQQPPQQPPTEQQPTEQPAETPTETTTPPTTTQDTPAEMEKDAEATKAEIESIAGSARELYRHLHTDAVCNELGIKKEKIFGEAQRLWGDSNNWDKTTWEKYLHGIAAFHERKGELYDALKPRTGEQAAEPNTQANGNGKSPF